MKVRIDMTEVSELAEILINEAPKRAIKQAKAATLTEARKVKSRAIANAPRDRPWLATAIHQKSWTNPGSVAANIYVETTDPEGRTVAFYVEYGTSKTAPQPFMEPAIAPAHQSYPDAVLNNIDPFRDPPPSSGGDE